MKKKIILGAIIGSLAGLLFSNLKAQKTVVNREVNSEQDGKLLLGKQAATQFKKEPYADWYNEEYNSYVLDAPTIEQLKKAKLSRYRITAFVGTWCPDTHREFPRFMRILEAIDFPMSHLEIIALSRKKESPEGEEVLEHVKSVPTFILKKHGQDIGRIVESPSSGFIEKDLLDMVNSQKHSTSKKRKKRSKKNKD